MLTIEAHRLSSQGVASKKQQGKKPSPTSPTKEAILL